MTNKEKYVTLCEKEPSICIYNQPWWMDAVCIEGGWDVLIYEKKGVIYGTIVYYWKRKYGFCFISRPPLTQHNGIWIKYPEDESCKNHTRIALEKEVTENLICQLENLHFLFYLQTHSPSMKNWLPFYWYGYRQTTFYTYRIEKTRAANYKTIFQDYNKATKKNIEKATTEAIISEIDDIKLFFKMQSKIFQKQGMKQLYSIELLSRLDKAIQDHNAGKMLCAKDSDGNYHCISYYVYDNEYVYQLMSGIDPKYSSSQFKTLLIEKAIKFACETKRGFDFEGSMLKNVEEYFRRFNSIQIPYFLIFKVYSKNILLRRLLNTKILEAIGLNTK